MVYVELLEKSGFCVSQSLAVCYGVGYKSDVHYIFHDLYTSQRVYTTPDYGITYT